MNENLKKLAKYLSNKIELAKDEILEEIDTRFDELAEGTETEIEELEEKTESEFDEEFEEEEKKGEIHGFLDVSKRQAVTEQGEPKKKKGLFGVKKKE